MSETDYVLRKGPNGLDVVTVWFNDDESASVPLAGLDPENLNLVAGFVSNAIHLAYKTGVEHGKSQRSRQIKDLLNID